MSIVRVNDLGYVGFDVYDGEYNIARFNTYHDAVDFVHFLNGLEYI